MEFSETKINQIEQAVKKKYEDFYPIHMDRFKHILGVKKMAILLSQKYHIDPSKAAICALVHDYYKYESNETLENYLKTKEDQEECKKYPVLYHSYASAEALEDVFMIKDSEMKSAIRNHVFGKNNMTMLEKVILISDYTEENRAYRDCITCRQILLQGHLEEAIYYSTKFTIDMLIKKGISPHPLQLEVLKEYERKIENE